MKIENQKFDVSIPTLDGKGIAEWVSIKIPMEWDDEVQEWLMTPEGDKRVEDTKSRHMGLLLPDEMKELRHRLSLTQTEIGALLQIGEKTWTRWESGKARPSRSVNLLLKALHDREITIDFLKRQKQSRTGWNKVIPFPNPKTKPIQMDHLMKSHSSSLPDTTKQRAS